MPNMLFATFYQIYSSVVETLLSDEEKKGTTIDFDAQEADQSKEAYLCNDHFFSICLWFRVQGGAKNMLCTFLFGTLVPDIKDSLDKGETNHQILVTFVPGGKAYAPNGYEHRKQKCSPESGEKGTRMECCHMCSLRHDTLVRGFVMICVQSGFRSARLQMRAGVCYW